MNRLIGSLLFALVWSSPHADEIILLDPNAHRPAVYVTDLFGYKRFPEELFRVQRGEKTGLPAELIYASASKTPAIEAAVEASGKTINELETGEVVELARAKFYEITRNPPLRSKTTTFVPWVGAQEIDAEFITLLLSSELINENIDIFDGDIVGDPVEMISINDDVGRIFWNAYSSLENFRSYDPFERLQQFETIQASLNEFPVLLQAAKISFSPVSFGEIFVYSKNDRDLIIPPPIDRKYDVFWVEFPVSLRDLEAEYVTEVSFHVFLPENARALDLIPWRFGAETVVTEESKTPAVTFKEVTIGEFYKKTVAYTTLKPTIVATGLREHKFSWILTGEAISTGSYLFVGVLGVPKGQCAINAGLGVNAKTTDLFGFQGDVAGTGIVFMEIGLPC